MSTYETPECGRIEEYVRGVAPDITSVECQKKFDTKDYLVWLRLSPKPQPDKLVITLEEYQDDRWQSKIIAKLEDLSS
jgi:hypothetical protein